MYIPSPFRVEDTDVISAFMQQFDFAAFVTHSDADGLVASHVPVLIRKAGASLRIVGHLARANSHWRLMDGRSESMVIFQGPHAYVSPSWYAAAHGAVPTWNYAVVHAYGRPQAREDTAFVKEVVEELTTRHESRRDFPWSTDALPTDSYERLLGAIVGFEMPITRFDAKFKLGQNRSAQDRAGAIAGLEREKSSGTADLADFMRRYRGGV
jgi:transcriptional regulator